MIASDLSTRQEKKLKKQRQLLEVFLGNLVEQISQFYKSNELDLTQILQHATEALPQETSLRKLLEKDVPWSIEYLETNLKQTNLQKNIKENSVLSNLLQIGGTSSISSIQQLCASIQKNSTTSMTNIESILSALKANSIFQASDLKSYSTVLYHLLKKRNGNEGIKKTREGVRHFISSCILLSNYPHENQQIENHVVQIDPIFNVIAWYLFSYSCKKKNKQESKTNMSAFLSTLLASRSFSAKLTIACASHIEYLVDEPQASKRCQLVFDILSGVLRNASLASSNELPSPNLVHDIDKLWMLMNSWAEKVIGKTYSILSWKDLDTQHVDDLTEQDGIRPNVLESQVQIHELGETQMQRVNKDLITKKLSADTNKIDYNSMAKSENAAGTERTCTNIKEDEALEIEKHPNCSAKNENEEKEKENQAEADIKVEVEKEKTEPKKSSTRRTRRKSMKALESIESAHDSTTLPREKTKNKKESEKKNDEGMTIDDDALVKSDKIQADANGETEDFDDSKMEASENHEYDNSKPKSRSTRKTPNRSLKALEALVDAGSTKDSRKGIQTSRTRSKRNKLPEIPEVEETAPPVETILVADEKPTRKRRSISISSVHSNESEESYVSRKIKNQNKDDNSVDSVISNSSLRRSSRRKKLDDVEENENASVNSVASNSSVRRSSRRKKKEAVEDTGKEEVSINSATSTTSLRRSSRRRKAVQKD